MDFLRKVFSDPLKNDETSKEVGNKNMDLIGGLAGWSGANGLGGHADGVAERANDYEHANDHCLEASEVSAVKNYFYTTEAERPELFIQIIFLIDFPVIT